jgi:hypothetical protein
MKYKNKTQRLLFFSLLHLRCKIAPHGEYTQKWHLVEIFTEQAR